MEVKDRKIIVYGKPKGKARPRFARVGNYVRTYTPKSTEDYEELVRISYLQQCKSKKIIETAISMKITAYFKPNKSTSRKKAKELINQPYIHKPDTDNIAKTIADALNGIAYKDDAQIAELIVEKKYGEEDKVEIEINKL